MSTLSKEKLEFLQVPFATISSKERARQMGLIILQTDQTIEAEFRQFLSQDENDKVPLSLLHTRIPCDDKVTSSNLSLMENRFTECLSFFPNNYHFDVIGYGCTSASLLIGDDRITEIVKTKVLTDNVTTPMLAVKRALHKLGTTKIGYIAPYISEIAHKMCSHLDEEGFTVVKAASFAEDRDSIVGLITPRSIFKAIEALINQSDNLDAIFISCTSLKCASIIPLAEKKFRLPIVSSNSALAWDMINLSKATVSKRHKGKLFNL